MATNKVLYLALKLEAIHLHNKCRHSGVSLRYYRQKMSLQLRRFAFNIWLCYKKTLILSQMLRRHKVLNVA